MNLIQKWVELCVFFLQFDEFWPMDDFYRHTLVCLTTETTF